MLKSFWWVAPPGLFRVRLALSKKRAVGNNVEPCCTVMWPLRKQLGETHCIPFSLFHSLPVAFFHFLVELLCVGHTVLPAHPTKLDVTLSLLSRVYLPCLFSPSVSLSCYTDRYSSDCSRPFPSVASWTSHGLAEFLRFFYQAVLAYM